MAGEEGLRLSLAGAQIKLPVVLATDGPDYAIRVALSLDGTPSTHIIKPEPPRFPRACRKRGMVHGTRR